MQVIISRRGRTNVQEIVVSTSSFGLMSQKYTKHALLPTHMRRLWKRWFHSGTYCIIVHLSPLGLSLGTSSIIRPFLAQVAWLHWHRHDQGRCVDTNGLDPSERGMASTTSRQDLHCNTPWVSPEVFFCWLI